MLENKCSRVKTFMHKDVEHDSFSLFVGFEHFHLCFLPRSCAFCETSSSHSQSRFSIHCLRDLTNDLHFKFEPNKFAKSFSLCCWKNYCNFRASDECPDFGYLHSPFGMESKTSRHHLHTTLLPINPLSLTKKRRQLKVWKLLPLNKPPINNPFCIPFQESCLEFERLVSAQCESLIQMIHERREFLIDTIRMDKETKLRTLKVGRTNFNWDKLLKFDDKISGAAAELHRQAPADDWPHTVLYRSP